MKRTHTAQLKPLISELIRSLRSTSSASDLRELLRIIHRPGWTTPAEVAFARGILTTTIQHLQVVAMLRNVLLIGSRNVKRS